MRRRRRTALTAARAFGNPDQTAAGATDLAPILGHQWLVARHRTPRQQSSAPERGHAADRPAANPVSVRRADRPRQVTPRTSRSSRQPRSQPPVYTPNVRPDPTKPKKRFTV